MRSRTLAIAGSIAALTFAATPVAAVAATTHHGTPAVQTDRSRDAHGVRHVDRSPDRDRADRSVDTADR
jgi:hypothetical protein